MPNDHEDLYTKPKLRRNLKKKIMAGKKGGRSGSWSSQKAQILIKKYEAKGGGYNSEKNDSMDSREDWTAQDWQILDGVNEAESASSMRDYLPAKVWATLSPNQQQRAESCKVRKDRLGRFFVEWPGCVYSAMTATGQTADSPKTVRKKRLERFARRLGFDSSGGETKGDFIRFINNSDTGSNKVKPPKAKVQSPKPKRSTPKKSVKVEAKEALQSLTKSELYEKAQQGDVPGRSTMNKDELIDALV